MKIFKNILSKIGLTANKVNHKSVDRKTGK